MKNLRVVVKYPIKLNKLEIHKVVKCLSNDLYFAICSLNIIFISDYEIEKINNNFLKHNCSTDVITFNYSENKDLDGEIIISVDDAAYFAKKYNVPLAAELNRLIIHGILHLLGYNDIDPKDKKVMKSFENKFVKKFEKINIVQ